MTKRFNRTSMRRMKLSLLSNTILGLTVVFAAYGFALRMFLLTMSLKQTRRAHRLERSLYHFTSGSLNFSPGQVGAQYLPQRPRIVEFPFFDASYRASRFSNYLSRYPTSNDTIPHGRLVDVSPDELERQQDLQDSEDYNLGKAEKFEDGDCVAQYDWQLQSFPTCNFILEQDLTQLLLIPDESPHYARYLASGYWRDVWMIADENVANRMAMKTIRHEHDYEARNYDRHRRDAIAMERLTSSPWVMNIYGFCGNSGLFEFADGGSLADQSNDWDEDTADHRVWNSTERLVVAYQVASGLADLHNFDMEGRASIAHADITYDQFVYSEQETRFKLNDFNRCRFIRWDENKNETCSYRVGNNPGPFRSPEEYAYEPQTEKVDVYSMGNILYLILTGVPPFSDIRAKKVPDIVKAGKRASFSPEILNSPDPFDKVLLKCILLCWIQDPEKRASSRQLQTYIGEQLSVLGVQIP